MLTLLFSTKRKPNTAKEEEEKIVPPLIIADSHKSQTNKERNQTAHRTRFYWSGNQPCQHTSLPCYLNLLSFSY